MARPSTTQQALFLTLAVVAVAGAALFLRSRPSEPPSELEATRHVEPRGGTAADPRLSPDASAPGSPRDDASRRSAETELDEEATTSPRPRHERSAELVVAVTREGLLCHGAEVTLSSASGPAHASTDDRGEVRFPLPAAGEAGLTIVADGAALYRARLSEVVRHEDGHARVDARLDPACLARVTVRNQDGEHVPYHMVDLFLLDASGLPNRGPGKAASRFLVTDVHGIARCRDLAPGTYEASCPDWRAYRPSERDALETRPSAEALAELRVMAHPLDRRIQFQTPLPEDARFEEDGVCANYGFEYSRSSDSPVHAVPLYRIDDRGLAGAGYLDTDSKRTVRLRLTEDRGRTTEWIEVTTGRDLGRLRFSWLP